jgi:hypothetical protein
MGIVSDKQHGSRCIFVISRSLYKVQQEMFLSQYRDRRSGVDVISKQHRCKDGCCLIRDQTLSKRQKICAHTEYLRASRLIRRLDDQCGRVLLLLRALAWNLGSVPQRKEMQQCGHGNPDLLTSSSINQNSKRVQTFLTLTDASGKFDST